MLWLKAFSKLSNLNWSMATNSKQETDALYILTIIIPNIIIKRDS